jgi:hypothetical protein
VGVPVAFLRGEGKNVLSLHVKSAHRSRLSVLDGLSD